MNFTLFFVSWRIPRHLSLQNTGISNGVEGQALLDLHPSKLVERVALAFKFHEQISKPVHTRGLKLEGGLQGTETRTA